MGNRNEVFYAMSTELIFIALEKSGFKVSTDSRMIGEGDVFFALQGDNFDGNKYAGEAIAGGASCAVIDNPEYLSEKTILVDDCLKALQQVAGEYRKRLHIPVLAITGSNGKTTSKELLARILGKKHKLHYTRGNLNNHIGLPLTILSCPADTEFLIIEMGASHVSEIKTLCRIAQPAYGIITNIGKAHLEGFGSLQGVIKAKSELFDYLEENNGKAFVNGNDELLSTLAAQRKLDVIPYLKPASHSISISEISQTPQLELDLLIDSKEYQLATNLFGIHNRDNIIVAISVGLYFEVPVSDILAAIESYLPDNNRSQIFNTGRNTLICDSYNANPDSMQKALESFSHISGKDKTVILGDMFELGEYAIEEHERIINYLLEMDDINILLIGEVFHSLAEKYKLISFSTTTDLIKHLSETPLRDNYILIKGSRSLELERIYGMV